MASVESMFSKKRRNAKERWEDFCHQHIRSLEEACLPEPVASSEAVFRELLYKGSVKTRNQLFSLEELDAKEWEGLKAFASKFFNEFESYAPLDRFLAFGREVDRRDSAS